jgi:predicted permease
MLTDLRHAWRALRRSPGYLAAAVLTLALGVGATTALFGVVDRVLLRPLPYADPARLVRVWPGQSAPDALYELLRDRGSAYQSLAAYTYPGDVSVLAGDRPARVTAAGVTGNLFATLGVAARIGRTLGEADARPGAPPAAVVSDAFWREHLGGDPRALGGAIAVDGARYRVVGVMPPRFAMPSARVAVWTPARIDRANAGSYWWSWRMNLVGRLAPGATAERAAEQSRAEAVRAGREAFPTPMNADYGRDLTVVPFQEALVGGSRATLLVLLGAVLVMLAVAVVNVTGLALVRAAGRAREITVRAAVGAGRARLARQLVAEGVVVAGLAGAAGAALAWGFTRLFVAALPPEGAPGALARAEEISVDGRALAAALVVALAAGVASALAPARSASRVDLRAALADGARGASGGAAGRRALEGLVAAQVALGVVLAAGAGLLATSLARLRAVDPGFRAAQVAVAVVPPPADGASAWVQGPPGAGGERARQFYAALLARARAVPGVRDAALASAVPFDGSLDGTVVDLEAHPRAPGGEWKTVRAMTVTPGAVRTLGIPLVAGRDLADADRAGAPGAVLVDVPAVRAYWPEFAGDVGRAVGQRVRRVNAGSAWETVVGVVGGVVRDSLSGEPAPTVYRAMAQDYPAEMRVVTRGAAGPEALAPALRRAVAELEPTVPLGEVRALGALVDDSAARPRFVAGVLAAFALAAVALGAVGVYGVVAFAVARRTREVGVRVALGATPAAVRAMVLRDGARLALLGGALGLAGAVAAGGAARRLFYGLGAVEPAVLAGVVALLAAVVLLASLAPARRAGRVSPLVAMRAD